jgi:hypothetical protein
MLGLAMITWLARNAPTSGALSAVLIGNLVGSAIALVLIMLQRIAGFGNALVWSTAVIYAFLAAGFAYFQFGKSQ